MDKVNYTNELQPSNQSDWFPIELSLLGRKTFPTLIGKRAYRIVSRRKISGLNVIRVKIIGQKRMHTMSKDFWRIKKIPLSNY